MLDQGRSLWREASEDESVIGVDPGHPAHRQIEFAFAVPLEERKADEVAVVAERPAVVGATERRGVTFRVVADLVATVGAAIKQEVHRALAVSGHDHVL